MGIENLLNSFFYSEFANSFWPGFVATVLGIVLGVPVALWVNDRMVARAEASARAIEQARFTKAKHILSERLMANSIQLKSLNARIQQGMIPFNPALDFSVWSVVRADVASLLHDPSLIGALAYHFLSLENCARLTRTYLDYGAGIASALGGSEQTRDALKSYLLTLTGGLAEEADQLVGKLGQS